MTKSPSVVYIGIAMAFLQSTSSAQQSPNQVGLTPKPKVERWSDTPELLTRSGQSVAIKLGSVAIKLAGAEGGAVAEGMQLLSRRLEILGFEMVREKNTPRIAMIHCSEESMKDRLRKSGVSERLDPLRTRQSYHLGIRKDESGVCSVRIEAPDPLGLYYGLLTLVQLLGKDAEGNLILPEGEILDYPEIGIRLAKTSASMSAPEDIERFAAWLTVNKLSHIGLQYHGKNSKHPEPHFPGNVTRFCAEFRRKGTLESIVYFCPFRGEVTGGTGAYDFTKQEDREDYVEYLRWIMEQGADGIEVDYNDWPGGPEVAISDVLNLACETVIEARPAALVLYCPPNRGSESYRGMATEQLGRTLSQVAGRVWPLWTGMQTLITEPLSEEQVLEWTRIAGRRPFLWVNRVGPAVKVPFVQKVEGEPGGLVFAGDFLPNDLNRLFEGVHLNAGLQSGYNKITGDFDDDALVYLATTADYLWNPHGWNPEESLQRARRFVGIIRPLVAKDSSEGTQSGTDRVTDMEPIIVYRNPERYTTFPDVKRLPNGDLLCVFRDASFPERVRHIENDARVVGVISKDDGLSWSSPEVIHECTVCHNDPSVCVLNDGRLLLTYFTWVGRSEEYVQREKPPFARKVDRGEWGMYAEPGGVFAMWGSLDPLRCEGEPRHIRGDSLRLAATSASVLETTSGTLLMPIYMREPDGPPDRAYVLRSEDGGKTWSDPVPIAEDPDGKIAMQEPALAQNRDGIIVCLMRTANAADHLYTVHSKDDGQTWSVPERTPLVGHPADLQVLPDGRMLAVYGYRHDPGWGVRGCVSDDGGITWDGANEFVITDRGGHGDLGYPSVCLVDDENVLVAYYMNGPDTSDRWIECKRISLASSSPKK